jgi:hypothetical protein
VDVDVDLGGADGGAWLAQLAISAASAIEKGQSLFIETLVPAGGQRLSNFSAASDRSSSATGALVTYTFMKVSRALAGVAVLSAAVSWACGRSRLDPFFEEAIVGAAGTGGAAGTSAAAGTGGAAGTSGAAGTGGAAGTTGGIQGKLVFVTSRTVVGGRLRGLTGADEICNQSASSVGLRGTFRAWLSDSTGSPSTRFRKSAGPYVLVDGTVVAASWTALTTRHLENPIDLTELGGPPPQATGRCEGTMVWSATKRDGSRSEPADCGDWSYPEGNGALWGRAGAVDDWSDSCYVRDTGGPQTGHIVCGSLAALYCFEQ